jgi:hypothetical protein
MKGCSDCKRKETSDARLSTFSGSFLLSGLLLEWWFQNGWGLIVGLLCASLITWWSWKYD